MSNRYQADPIPARRFNLNSFQVRARMLMSCLMEFINMCIYKLSLRWRHNECDCVSNHRRPDCLLKRLFRCRWKKTSKFCVTGLCEGKSAVTGEFPAQMASDAEHVSIWWRHHGVLNRWDVRCVFRKRPHGTWPLLVCNHRFGGHV